MLRLAREVERGAPSSISMIWGGLRAGERACTLCASGHLRRSRLPTPGVARLLGLVLCRCQTCWRPFLLPSRLLQLEPTEVVD